MPESDNGFCPKCGHPVYDGIKHDCAAWSATTRPDGAERMTAIDVEVTECADCPAYRQDRRGFCRCHFVPRRDLPDDDLPVPRWCPLLQTSVTLRLKGGE